MAKAAAPKIVYCYNCGHRIEVGRRTMSTSCPGCSKPVIVEDIVVKSYKAVVNVETCGKLIVPKRGRVVAQKRVVAHGGIEVEGSLTCGQALSAGAVTIGAKAEWRGDLRAVSLEVKAGAKILGGYFEIPHDPLADYREIDEPTAPAQPPTTAAPPPAKSGDEAEATTPAKKKKKSTRKKTARKKKTNTRQTATEEEED